MISRLLITSIMVIIFSLSTAQVMAVMTARVAVLPFEISSSENMEYLKNTIQRELSAQLATKKGVSIIDPVTIKSILDKGQSLSFNEDVLRRVAEKLEAHFLVLGSMTSISKNLRLDAYLFNAVDSPSFTKYFIEGNELTPLIGHMVRKISVKVLFVVDTYPEFQELELIEAADLKEEAMVNPSLGTKPPSSSPSEKEVIQKLILDWEHYWESKDIENYMSCYSKEFTSKGIDWHRWKTYKKHLNDKYHQISLSLNDPHITLKGNQALVSFKQHYQSDEYSDYGMKSLRLKKGNGDWKIFAEQWEPL